MVQLRLLVTALLLLTAMTSSSVAQEVDYFVVRIPPSEGDYDPDQVVSREAIPNNAWYQMDSDWRVVVDAESEAYIVSDARPGATYDGARIVGMKPRGKAIEGTVYALLRSREDNQKSVLVRRPFQVAAQPDVAASRDEFLVAKGRYYERFWAEQHAGSAIWRHLAIASLQEAGQKVENFSPRWPIGTAGGADSTFALMSGGRAISENLQLDRQLPVSDVDAHEDTSVDLSTVRGITIAEVNWSQRLGDMKVELDPLAAYVPHDQYALYLPNFQTLITLIDRGLRLAKPLLFWFEPQSRAVDVQGFYQRQLGLTLGFAARNVGGTLIDEVAITGSDLYFTTGTDVAILMQSKQSKVLFELIAAQIATAGQMRGALRSNEEIEGSTVICWKTADRQMSSYIVQLTDAVVVSNSPEQIRQVLRARTQNRPAMKDLDEYKFFRSRYPRKPDQNKSFVIITDAAIRRWCGPEWRIAAARRTRARAELADLTVQHMDSIVAGSVTGEKAMDASTHLPSLGDLFLSSRGVRSATFGTLAFQTPIAEMALKSATRDEVRLYGNWRVDYQRRWRNVFDPIAMEVLVDDEDIQLDLSVIPLILESSYRYWIELSGAGRLKNEHPAAHPESMLSSSIAIDVNSEGLAYIRVLLEDVGGADLLNWIDGELTWHVDYDQAWFERQEARSPWGVGDSVSLHDVPIGLFVPSRDNLRMVAFIVALRAWIERVAPNLITWKEKSFGDVQYVVGTFKDSAMGSLELPQIYYATIPSGFALSANEQVLLRMVKHRTEQVAGRVEGQQENEADAGPNAEPKPNYAFRLSGKGMQWDLWRSWNSGLRWNSRLAWSNIPAMNYLRSRYPDKDPIAVYALLFGEQLVDPAEGEYLWSETMQTFESSHYGHHLAPKAGPSVIVDAQPSDVAEASLSFEEGGLRARFQLDRGKDKQ